MKQQINELLNSGLTLSKKEKNFVEDYIQSQIKVIKPQHLDYFKSLAAVRGKGSDRQG